MKQIVEDYVRGQLERQYGMKFESRILDLTTGGTHEFDAVSTDLQVVASIKAAGGKTTGGRLPSGKMRNAKAELYYLTLTSARKRLLVLTLQGVLRDHVGEA